MTKTRKIPMRRCAGCMQSKTKSELVRISLSDEGIAGIDPSGKAPGRGVYLCKDIECFDKARKKKALGRSLRTDTINSDQYDMLRNIYESYLHSAEGN